MTPFDRLWTYAHSLPEGANLPAEYGCNHTLIITDIIEVLAELTLLRAQVRRTVYAREVCGNEW